MSHRGKTFFRQWIIENLGSGEPWADRYPTPSVALAALRADAAEAGVLETELQAGIGDPVVAVVEAMAAAPKRHRSPEARSAETVTRVGPAEALQVAISYLDGFRDVVGTDLTLAAHLVLRRLKHQGYVVRALDNRGAEADALHQGGVPAYHPVTTPRDIGPSLEELFGTQARD